VKEEGPEYRKRKKEERARIEKEKDGGRNRIYKKYLH
jgi:hypothetical protein